MSSDVTEIRQDIEQHRAELAATVDLLADKLDVKSRLKARAEELRPLAVPVGGAVAVLVLVVTVVKRRRS